MTERPAARERGTRRLTIAALSGALALAVASTVAGPAAPARDLVRADDVAGAEPWFELAVGEGERRGTVAVRRGSGALAAGDEAVARWVRRNADAVGAYFGGLPVRRVEVTIRPVAGDDRIHGTTFGHGPARIEMRLGSEVVEADLADDWVLPHELCHLALPSVPEESHWLEEGMATYVEPVARVRAGAIPEERFWRELVRGLPQGQPRRGDRGLDRTPTWARTYWGGALFCFVADVEIRRRTDNRHGLEDALRGVIAAGGHIERRWRLADVLAAADGAVGVPVLAELHARMGREPVEVDLEDYWRRLGVVRGRRGRVAFDDAAPWAAIRRAITAP